MSENEKIITEVEEQEQPKKDLSGWERIKYLIIEPSKTMEYLGEKPKVLFPLLCILLGFVLLMIPKMELMREFTQEKILDQLAAQGMDTTQITEGVLNIALWSGLVAATVMPFLAVLIKSIIMHPLAKLMEGTGKLKAVFSVVAYAYLISLIGEAVRTLIALLTQNFMVQTSLAMFLPDTQFGKPLYTLFSYLDVFTIWYLIVATIGVAYAHKISRTKSAILVFGTWGILILFGVVSAAMQIKG